MSGSGYKCGFVLLQVFCSVWEAAGVLVTHFAALNVTPLLRTAGSLALKLTADGDTWV